MATLRVHAFVRLGACGYHTMEQDYDCNDSNVLGLTPRWEDSIGCLSNITKDPTPCQVPSESLANESASEEKFPETYFKLFQAIAWVSVAADPLENASDVSIICNVEATPVLHVVSFPSLLHTYTHDVSLQIIRVRLPVHGLDNPNQRQTCDISYVQGGANRIRQTFGQIAIAFFRAAHQNMGNSIYTTLSGRLEIEKKQQLKSSAMAMFCPKTVLFQLIPALYSEHLWPAMYYF